MMFVAIVESEKLFADYLSSLLYSWVQKRNSPSLLRIHIFSSGEEFLESELNDYRVIFMAVKLAGNLDGIETARCVKKMGYSTPVVITTLYEEYVFEGYQVDALDYLIKPVSPERLEACMERIMEQDAAGVYTIITATSMQKIPYRDIMYFQSFNHYVEIHMADGYHKQLIALSKLVRTLPLQFCRCHRTMIVNMNYVKRISGMEVEMQNGKCFPISASYLNEMKECFLKRLL
ncbi:LytR/AlgR family response regulator transcription factor [Hungatella hathewayi]|uniref:Stage 0 sporulation protein A homolog n=1 Tax=Hungatella hathewayi WAL-18680 TaxID=742737 RepID=G5IN10_9FIRM|nr:LytTR family DNA-binding domain-containing protein [Hungatella hathewayi]EHI56981.1 hypothetical protein HMPREF9473_04888 [ [Hungatella hathewayi WAL-18680]MBS4986834.1 response regulator transcription factor [Hungatella hathewayi]